MTQTHENSEKKHTLTKT